MQLFWDVLITQTAFLKGRQAVKHRVFTVGGTYHMLIQYIRDPSEFAGTYQLLIFHTVLPWKRYHFQTTTICWREKTKKKKTIDERQR